MKKSEVREEFKVFAIHATAMVGAYLLKRLTEKIVEDGFEKKVPKDPDEDEDISWIEAIGWAAFMGATAGTMKFLLKKGAKIELDKIL